MNKETIHLSLDLEPTEADSLAYVMMSALKRISMLPRERTHVTEIVNELFKQLGYSHGTDSQGDRIEWDNPTIEQTLANKIGLEVGESKDVEFGGRKWKMTRKQ